MATLGASADPRRLVPPGVPSPHASSLEGQPVAAALAHEATRHQLSWPTLSVRAAAQDGFSTTASSPSGNRAGLSQLAAPHRAVATHDSVTK